MSTQSAAERRAAEAQVRSLIVRFAPAQLRLIGATRRRLQKRLPTAHEIVYEYRDCFVISYSPSEHGYQGVLAIRASADGVRLYINQGKGLPDPEKLLQGSSQARWLDVEGAATLTRPAVVCLIDAALARNSVSFAATGRGPIVIRATSATQRRQRSAEPGAAAAVRPPEVRKPRKALTEPIGALADAVLAHPLWVRDDLNVSILGMILYGFALATAEEEDLAVTDVDAAVLWCLTKRIGAAAKWSRGIVKEANTSANDKSHHAGHHEIIGLGRTYSGVEDQRALVNNVFANFVSVRERSGVPLSVPRVSVFLTPLAVLLAAREEEKGAPLTRAEVIEVRDTALCTPMPYSQAVQFYASMDNQAPLPPLNPQRIWQEWQAIRGSMVRGKRSEKKQRVSKPKNVPSKKRK